MDKNSTLSNTDICTDNLIVGGKNYDYSIYDNTIFVEILTTAISNYLKYIYECVLTRRSTRTAFSLRHLCNYIVVYVKLSCSLR